MAKSILAKYYLKKKCFYMYNTSKIMQVNEAVRIARVSYVSNT